MKLLKNVSLNLPYNDIFSNVESSLSTLAGKIQGISGSIVVLCLVIVGVMFLMGEDMSRKGKTWLLYIAGGAFIIFGAATLSTTIQDIAGF